MFSIIIPTLNNLKYLKFCIYSIEKNTWFAMKPKGKYSLIGCTVAPAFEFEDLELAPKDWKPSKFNLSLK